MTAQTSRHPWISRLPADPVAVHAPEACQESLGTSHFDFHSLWITPLARAYTGSYYLDNGPKSLGPRPGSIAAEAGREGRPVTNFCGPGPRLD